jgi:prevent-host-death family protein
VLRFGRGSPSSTQESPVAQTLVPTERIELDIAEQDLADLVDRVVDFRSRLVLTRNGRTVAALVPVVDLERLERDDAQWEEDMAVFHEIGKAFADVDPEEIERETAKALAEVRAEMRAEREAVRSK